MPVLRLPKFGKPVKYAYITGRVRAMKTKLIPNEMYARMLNMDIPEIARYLEETQYKEEIDALAKDYSGAELIEHATFANLAKTYRKLLEVSIDEPQFLILEYLRRWDIWNIKTILRGKFYGASDSEIMKYIVPAGELDREFLEGLAKKDSINDVIAAFEGTDFAEALSKYDGKFLASVENALDKLYYFRMERAVGGTLSVGGGLLLKYVRREIDIKNLITLFRMNKAGIEASIVQENLIPGGKLGEELSRMAGQPYADFVRGLEGYPFWSAISDVATADLDGVSRIEARLKAYLIRYAWSLSNYHPLSILPVLGYIVTKETEVANIRKIVRGKEAGLPNELIEEQMVVA
ncbi:V-type ATP synthase subunit C [Methanothrix sp.]|uniref:V-type ATP synthase subunit C n=1 Tax=Methanothrix sp. TaxID=90426 RepID=UPI00247C99F5|nr:V-type ATP synthase subunit C [Methanothrix sp.]MDH7597685.1 V-type ATP synthase subunit C [Methanothrix sp.]HOK57636.1 V-type ATP synthase subunit C [Methanothrix sp.]HOL42828.1 V-type ATP synthase subunit C [Methanothrix sp.]HPO87920.1 V-type ATP synthase subunit C [Methanothrix sp.]